MSANETKLREAFASSLNIEPARVSDDLAYAAIPEWDSMAHMILVTALEGAFDVMLDAEEILDMSSVAQTRSILARHGVEF